MPSRVTARHAGVRAPQVLLLIAVSLWAADRYEASEPHMGTVVSITLYAESPEQAQRAFVAAFGRIAELDKILSDYKPESELSRVCELDSLSRDLRAVISHAQAVARATDGAFDITAGPLTRLRRLKRPATDAELADALSRSGYRKLDESFRCSVEGMQLDAGGIAKGYAADEALRALRAAGIRSALVAVSGDVAMSDAPPGRRGWRVRVQDQVLTLANAAVSTSGDEFQGAHILDPRTGAPLRNMSPVSVVASTGIDADAWSTAYAVQGRKGIIHLPERR